MDITWRMDATILGISLLTVADASSFVSANNPSFLTTRRFAGNTTQVKQETAQDIHLGLGKATLETIAIGFGGALVTKSWWPLALPIAYMALQLGWFRWALANPHPKSPDIGSNQIGLG